MANYTTFNNTFENLPILQNFADDVIYDVINTPSPQKNGVWARNANLGTIFEL